MSSEGSFCLFMRSNDLCLPFSESGTFMTGGGLCRFLNSISRLDGSLGFSGSCLLCNPGGKGFGLSVEFSLSVEVEVEVSNPDSNILLEGGLCLFCTSFKMPSEGGLCLFMKSNLMFSDGNFCPSIKLKWDFSLRILSFGLSKKLLSLMGDLLFQPKLDSFALPILSSFCSGATQSQNAPRTTVAEMVNKKKVRLGVL